MSVEDKATFKAELLADVPLYDDWGKRLMVLAPLIAIIANSLINMTINARNLATTGFGPYNSGPVRLTSPKDQKTYSTVGSYGDLWGQGWSTYQIFSYGSVYYPSVPAVTYVSCAAGHVHSAYLTCNFVNNTAFDGLIVVFVVYFLFYPTSDLRYFVLAEKYKTTIYNQVFVAIGHAITLSGFAVGIYYARKANGGAEVFGRQIIYLAINVTAFYKLSFSAFPDLKHLDMDVQLPDEISVLPFRASERKLFNGWGCLVRSEALIRRLEQAVLRAYLSGTPECILKFGDREPLEKALYLIHLKEQPGSKDSAVETERQDDKIPPKKLLRRASTISVVAEQTESWLNPWLTFFFRVLHCDRAHAPVSEEEDKGDDGLDWQTKRERYIAAHSSTFDHLVRFWLFIVPIAVLAINSLSNVTTIAQSAAQTAYTGYPRNVGTGYPFVLDSVETQAYAGKMQAGQFFVPSTDSACSNLNLGSTTCYAVDASVAFTGMPLWEKCGIDTLGVLESGYICPYLNSPTFYALIFIWVAIIFILAAASLASSFGFSVCDARRALAENHFRGSMLNRGLACVVLGYTLATGITAIVYLPNAVITYFNVLLYILLNIKAVSTLTSVTSIEITRFPDIAKAFPDAVELNLSLVQPSDVLYSLELELLKSYLTGDDRYIERVADKKTVEAFLAKAYLHHSDEEGDVEGEDRPSLVGLKTETDERDGFNLVSVSDTAPSS